MKKLIRVGGVCIFKDKILLIHRVVSDETNTNNEYYVIPGGGVELDEEFKSALKREMFEETSLDLNIKEIFFEMEDINPSGLKRHHYYYLCEYISGEPKLNHNSPEFNNGIGLHEPMWLDISKLENISLYPSKIKEVILKKYNNKV